VSVGVTLLILSSNPSSSRSDSITQRLKIVVKFSLARLCFDLVHFIQIQIELQGTPLDRKREEGRGNWESLDPGAAAARLARRREEIGNEAVAAGMRRAAAWQRWHWVQNLLERR
jgi:hypothetical protein